MPMTAQCTQNKIKIKYRNYYKILNAKLNRTTKIYTQNYKDKPKLK